MLSGGQHHGPWGIRCEAPDGPQAGGVPTASGPQGRPGGQELSTSGSLTSARSMSAESAISLSSTAQRKPCRAVSTQLTSVVLPAPR